MIIALIKQYVMFFVKQILKLNKMIFGLETIKKQLSGERDSCFYFMFEIKPS